VRCLKLPRGRKIKVDLRPSSTVQDLVGWISAMTCQSFIVPAGLAAQRVTVLAPHPITPREAYRIFSSALQAMGLALVPAGRKSFRVSRGDAASRGAVRTFGPGQTRRLPRSAEVVTQLWRPRWARAQTLLPLLSQLKDRSASVLLYAPANTLIVTAAADNLRRLLRIARALDRRPRGGQSVYLIRPRHAEAAELAKLIEQLFAPKKGGGRVTSFATPRSSSRATRGRERRRRAPLRRSGRPASHGGPSSPAADAPRVLADAHSNTLVVVADAAAYRRVAALVRAVDVEAQGARSRPWVYRLRHGDAVKLAAVLSAMLGHASGASRRGRRGKTQAPAPAFEGAVRVQADKDSNALVVLATARDYLGLRSILRELDRPRRQVYVQAHIIEANVGSARDLGISLHGGGITGSTTIVGGQSYSGLNSLVFDASTLASLGGLSLGVQGKGIPGTAEAFGLNQNLGAFGLLIKALSTTSNVDFLSSPHVLTLDNQKAEVVVGDSIPLPSGTTAAASAAAASGNSNVLAALVQPVRREEVGVKLTITPTIGERDQLRLKVEQEVSEVAKEEFGTGLGASLSKRKINTVVALRDGQTVVIGGLVKKRTSTAVSKIPILGDLPILGRLFRTEQTKKERVNLLVVLTPHVIRDQSDLRRIFKRKMRERQALLRAFGKDGRQALTAMTDLDFSYKRGLLATIDRVGAEIERRVTLEQRAADDGAPGRRELGPLRLAPRRRDKPPRTDATPSEPTPRGRVSVKSRGAASGSPARGASRPPSS
jgi:general secretion pathway protein D